MVLVMWMARQREEPIGKSYSGSVLGLIKQKRRAHWSQLERVKSGSS